MTSIVLRGILTRKLRTVLTSLAILLGVAMISGTFVLTDQINTAFDDIFARSNKGIDAIVSPREAFTTENGAENRLLLPESLVARVRDVPGVRLAEGSVGTFGYSIVKGGEYYGSKGGAPSLVYSHTSISSATTIDRGRYPEAPGHIAIDRDLAKRAKVNVGDRVGMTTETGTVPVEVSGVFKFAASVGGATVVLTTLPDAQRWFRAAGQVSTISVAGDEGVTDTQLVERIRGAVGGAAEVKTGTQDAQDQAKQINDQIGGFLTPALLAFAGVAVLVGAFIIFNTFSITVAQRMREFAMLRTLGASRRQVLRAVLGEALVVSLIASILGIVAGFGVAAGIGALFDAVGFGLPSAAPTLALRTVLVALVVGVGITLLASFVPARRATRVPPIAALREGATLPPGRFARLTPFLAAVIGALGVLLLVLGFASSGAISTRLLGMALGAVLVFVAVAMLSRYAVGPLARLIGAPIERLDRSTGRVARENAVRNPSRTAVTSAALMIGIGLVIFMAVFAQGLKQSFTGAIDRSVQGDLIVTANGGQPLPGGLLSAVRASSGVGSAAAIRDVEVRVGSSSQSIAAVDPQTFPRLVRLDWKNGSEALIGRLGTDGAVLNEDFARERGLEIGDRFAATSTAGRSASYRVLGTFEDQQGLFDSFVVSDAGVARLTDDETLAVVFVKAAPGVSSDAVQGSVERSLKQFPIANVQSNAEFKKTVEDQVGQLLALLYALLAMSVIISLFGMVNTLVLSIFERTREIGMLRAVGLTRWQLRRMVGYESIVTAVIGGILGVAVGLFFGWVITKGLESEGLEFAVPYGTVVLFLVFAVGAGLLAAVLPARRAARLRPLEALHYE